MKFSLVVGALAQCLSCTLRDVDPRGDANQSALAACRGGGEEAFWRLGPPGLAVANDGLERLEGVRGKPTFHKLTKARHTYQGNQRTGPRRRRGARGMVCLARRVGEETEDTQPQGNVW